MSKPPKWSQKIWKNEVSDWTMEFSSQYTTVFKSNGTVCQTGWRNKDTGYYKDSCELMMFRPPTIADYKKERESHRLVTINSDKWNKNQEILYNLLKDVKVLDADFKLFVKDFMETIEYE